MSSLMTHFVLPASPILNLWVFSVLFILLESFPKLRFRSKVSKCSLMVTAGSIVLTILAYRHLSSEPPQELSSFAIAFQNFFKCDVITYIFFLGILLFSFLSLMLFSSPFEKISVRSEIYILTLFIASALMLLVSARNLLMVFVALEFLSLPTYTIVGIFRKDKLSLEASLKYFLFGSVASVILLLGIALLYDSVHTFQMDEIALAVRGGSAVNLKLIGGFALVLSAAFFKIGIVPFHMWLPDVYQGAPTVFTGFMGSAIKISGFGLIVRLFWEMFLPLYSSWSEVIDGLVLITMVVGNSAAILQNDLKRIFAYSTISHAGFLLLSVVSLSHPQNYLDSLYYYLIVYGFTFVGTFAFIGLIENSTHKNELSCLSGLGFKYPVLGAAISIIVLSSAGIPPTAGFMAKYLIFLDAIRAGKVVLVVGGVLSSLIGIYYYLRILVQLYMKSGVGEVTLGEIPRNFHFCIVICSLMLLLLFCLPRLYWMIV